MDKAEFVDHSQFGEGHQTSSNDEGGDGRTKHCKQDDGAKVLEEVTLNGKEREGKGEGERKGRRERGREGGGGREGGRERALKHQ